MQLRDPNYVMNGLSTHSNYIKLHFIRIPKYPDSTLATIGIIFIPPLVICYLFDYFTRILFFDLIFKYCYMANIIIFYKIFTYLCLYTLFTPSCSKLWSSFSWMLKLCIPNSPLIAALPLLTTSIVQCLSSYWNS